MTCCLGVKYFASKNTASTLNYDQTLLSEWMAMVNLFDVYSTFSRYHQSTPFVFLRREKWFVFNY